MKLQIVLKLGDRPLSSGKVYTFKEGRCLIGRKEGQIQPVDGKVSARHALIFQNGDAQLCITDLDSRNGTFVNGQRVRTTVLKPGDCIKVGNHTLVISNWTETEKAEPKAETPKAHLASGAPPANLLTHWPEAILSLPKKQQEQFNSYFFFPVQK